MTVESKHLQKIDRTLNDMYESIKEEKFSKRKVWTFRKFEQARCGYARQVIEFLEERKDETNKYLIEEIQRQAWRVIEAYLCIRKGD